MIPPRQRRALGWPTRSSSSSSSMMVRIIQLVLLIAMMMMMMCNSNNNMVESFQPAYPATSSRSKIVMTQTTRTTTTRRTNISPSLLFQQRQQLAVVDFSSSSSSFSSSSLWASTLTEDDTSSTSTSSTAASADMAGGGVVVNGSSSSGNDNDVDIPIEDLLPKQFMREVTIEAEKTVKEMMDETCEVDETTGEAVDEICTDDEMKRGFRSSMYQLVSKTLELVVGGGNNDDDDDVDVENEISSSSPTTTKQKLDTSRTSSDDILSLLSEGEQLERGWEKRASSSALVRNAEVWKFALKSVFRALKPRKMRKKGTYTEEEMKQAQIDAAIYIRDGLLTLGPSFVKLGQVLSTRTDVLPKTYTDILKTLTDDVPGFSGERAKEIITTELGRPYNEIFQDLSSEPIKAASLGQVHTAIYKGNKVAIKVQRSGLKELFDVDLKNLKKLAILLDKFDPKSDGADRDWVGIYEESEKQLYKEIDYINEANNAERFAKDFASLDEYNYVKVPSIYRDVTTPRVLVMEYVDSFKLTNLQRIEKLGLDRKLLAKRVADTFLRQIVETSYFHADPHSGNLCVNDDGQLVFYDFGQMDELSPTVRNGFRTFCTALFAGGPKINDIELAKNAKRLVNGVEQAGVLSTSADRLAVEKLARYFMRTFKDNQLGKSSNKGIKTTLGTDLQTLTENNSFRFPSTFTFVFRAFVSIEGIGKELDNEFDIGKLAQPFIEKFTDTQKGYSSPAEKNFDIFRKATGLNSADIETAIMQPKKVAYIEETMRSMENGSLKVRVRSLENEKALERMNYRQDITENVLFASLLLNIASFATRVVAVRNVGIIGGCYFIIQAFISKTKITKFDKTQAKYMNTDFVEATTSTTTEEEDDEMNE